MPETKAPETVILTVRRRCERADESEFPHPACFFLLMWPGLVGRHWLSSMRKSALEMTCAPGRHIFAVDL